MRKHPLSDGTFQGLARFCFHGWPWLCCVCFGEDRLDHHLQTTFLSILPLSLLSTTDSKSSQDHRQGQHTRSSTCSNSIASPGRLHTGDTPRQVALNVVTSHTSTDIICIRFL